MNAIRTTSPRQTYLAIRTVRDGQVVHHCRVCRRFMIVEIRVTLHPGESVEFGHTCKCGAFNYVTITAHDGDTP